jgi:phenylacetate-CoA ligase
MHEAAQQVEFELLMKSQFWPADRLAALQRQRLETLLRHARAHVPFYGSRLAPLFRQDGSIDWGRWGDVPTLRRADLVAGRRALLSRTVPGGHEQIGDISTSGSTGTPVTTSHSSLALELSKAAVFRANVNDRLDFGGLMGLWDGEKAGVAAWPEGRTGGPWGPAWDPHSIAGRSVTVSHTTPPAQTLEFMGRHGVRYMMMGGTDARLLAHEARRLGVQLTVEAILTRGTDATDAGRALVAEVFGARTLGLYSSKEGHRMAHPCPECGRWHVNDEQVLVEILGDDDLPVAPGGTGRVVITPLNSFAQPLLRYEQGDIATRGAPGGCARGLSSIDKIVGRVRHMFVLPDGSRVVPTLSVAAVDALNAAMFQVAQVARDAVEVRYVPLANSRVPDDSAAVNELKAILHDGMRIGFVRRERFEVPPGRKHIEYLNEIEEA